MTKIRYLGAVLGIGLVVIGFWAQKDGNSDSEKMTSQAIGQQHIDAAWPDKLSGRIVFQSDRDGDWEIFAMNSDGSRLVQLTYNSNYDGYPVWSPDGKEIAFESDRDGNTEIYLMNADGSNQRRLTDHPANEGSPAWSPDGTRIAFDSDRVSVREIYLMNADGSQIEPWTKTVGKNALPAWSPDGTRLAYTGNRYLGWNVYVMMLDKSHDTRLTEGHGACRPDWSPDGQKIAYVSHKSDKKGDIWVMNPDGSSPQQLTFDNEHADYYPSWSPSGEFLAYAKNEGIKKRDNWELFVLRLADGQQLKLTNHPANEKFPDWTAGRITQKPAGGQAVHYYEAEDLPRQIGSVRQDPDASRMKAVYNGDAETEGFLQYGPYQLYAPANYVATFRLRSDAVESRDPLVRLEVVADNGQRMLAWRELNGQDFASSHSYQEFSLPFSLKQEGVLEFRVYSFLGSALWVDQVGINIQDAS